MCSNTLIELFGHIVYSFTRGVSEHYNPDEPEQFVYNPLQSTGREWRYHPVDELIYQEYSDREPTSLDYLTSSSLDVRVIDACTPDDNENTQEDHKVDDKAMEWKRLRPSAFRTVCQSLYIGAMISLFTSAFIGTLYMLVSYLCYNTILICRFSKMEYFTVHVQWVRAAFDLCASAISYTFSFSTFLLLFCPYQLTGVKRKLFRVCCLTYFLDSIYRVVLQARGTPYYLKVHYRLPLYAFFMINVSIQIYVLAGHFCVRSVTKLAK